MNTRVEFALIKHLKPNCDKIVDSIAVCGLSRDGGSLKLA
jgi:hypothetical protein